MTCSSPIGRWDDDQVALALALMGLDPSEAPPDPTIAAVRDCAARAVDSTEDRDVLGAMVAAHRAGKVTALPISEGGSVAAGDLLAKIE